MTAHGDTGAIEPVLVEQADGRLAIDVQVVLTYTNDGERAEGATVTAVATDEDGTAIGPVTLTPATAPGAYVAVLDVPAPGRWTVQLESTDPTASLEVAPVQVDEVEVATTTTATTIASTTSTAEPRATTDQDDGAMTGAIAVAVGVVVVGAAIGFRLARRRR